MGVHRFLHTLDLYGTEPPVIEYDPSEVDSRKDLRANEAGEPIHP